jgi:hypothetical protein
MVNKNKLQSARFHVEALLLLFFAVPFLVIWLWESGLYFELQGYPQGELGDPVTAAHRIAGWLIPLTLSSVFAFGIAHTEPDPRLVTMGRHDPRRVWLHRWLPVAGIFLCVALASAGLLSWWSTESFVRLIGATATTTVFVLASGFTIVVLTGASPGVAALGTAIVVAGAMFVLPLLSLPITLSLSPGPLGWRRGEPYHAAFLVHNAVILGVAVIIVWIALHVPRDARRIRWIANFRGRDA